MAVVGLRERKKLARRAELLACAVELFRTTGFEKTTMEDIARRADVSPPTVYNYFPTKDDLLLAVFWQAREHSKKDIDPILESPPEDPVEALTLLMVADMADMRTPADKKLWREILAAQVRNHERARDEIYSYKFVFESYLRQMLLHLIATRRLSKDLDYRVAAKTLYAVTWDVFGDLIADERAAPADTRAWIEPQVRLLLRGWLTKPHGAAATKRREPATQGAGRKADAAPKARMPKARGASRRAR